MDANTIANLVRKVTKPWAKQRKREEREANAAARRRDALTRSLRMTLREAAFKLMESAYLKASANGTLPARPRQIMYAARPKILEWTDRESLDGQYFAQTLLIDFMAENPETTETWDIAWDDRGHFAEPHTGRVIGLGTLAVREYLASVAAGVNLSIRLQGGLFPTLGPTHRFQGIIFIEREGFLPLFEAVHLAERFDIAIMSTKGMSVTAARTLVDRLCGDHQIPLLILRDFDKSGFSIRGTLTRSNRRYAFENQIEAIDLGLRLEDVRKHDLQSERVTYKSDPSPNLGKNGATDAEIDFLCSDRPWDGECSGHRVELNAFTSDALIAWIEGKLKKHGIKKVVPDAGTLEDVFRRATAIAKINKVLPALFQKEADTAKVPANLVSEVRKRLRDNPAMPWDAVVAELAKA